MEKKRVIAIIPARMASSRFPGKPMALIHGIPMVGHCYFRVKMCPEIDETYVATCDTVIQDYISSIGGKAVLTATTHERASDRTAEAMLKVEQETGCKMDIVVMVQGDEPMDTPKMIGEALQPILQDETVSVVNLMGDISDLEEFEDPNTVKVVVGLDGNAIYFSREPIPSRKKGFGDVPMRKQICVIPFRREFLLEFNQTPETPLEVIESVDMLRIIESGGRVKMVMTSGESYGVDTVADLEKVTERMNDDPLMARYC